MSIVVASLAVLLSAPAPKPPPFQDVLLEGATLRLEWSQQQGELTSTVPELTGWRVHLQAPWPVERVDRWKGEARLHHAIGVTTLKLERHGEREWLQVETTVVNRRDEPVVYNEIASLRWWAEREGGGELAMLGTGGLSGIADFKGSYAWAAMAERSTRHTAACPGVVAGFASQHRSSGVFRAIKRPPSVASSMQFGQLQVAPKTDRETDTLLFGLVPDARLGLEAYADAVADSHRILLPPKPGVYCTWYHAQASDERRLAANARFAREQLASFGLDVFQIDDGWQSSEPLRSFPPASGPISPRPQNGPVKLFERAGPAYPSGMQAAAAAIAEQGFTPGLWLMPFAGDHTSGGFDPRVFAHHRDGRFYEDDEAYWSGTCLDPTGSLASQLIEDRIARTQKWGFRYLKLDGIHTGLATPNTYINTGYRDDGFGEAALADPTKTPVEAYRTHFHTMRQRDRDTFLLGCTISQNMRSFGASFGAVDAMRIGPDNGAAARGDWEQAQRGAWHGSNLWFCNGRIWHNDPDPIYVREQTPEAIVRWMASWVAVAGTMVTVSEQFDTLPPERLDLIRRVLPAHAATARPCDIWATDRPQVWKASDERMVLVGLFNWDDEPTTVNWPLVDLVGGEPQSLRAYRWWDDRFATLALEAHGGSPQLAEPLTARGCELLAVRSVAEHPVVLSTSRHLTQGLVDIVAEEWDESTATLSGRSRVVAGDRYELRLAWNATDDWTPRDGTLGGQALEDVSRESDLAGTSRMAATPTRTGEVAWSIRFGRPVSETTSPQP